MDSAATPALTGAVLAGGRSRRMGQDKALLVVDSEPLVVRVARRLEAVCDRVVIAGDSHSLDGLGYPRITDAAADVGPLGGIVAALEVAATPLVAVVAVDMPFAAPSVLAQLARTWTGQAAVVPVVSGRVQPLHGVYATGRSADFRRCMEMGMHRLSDVLTEVGARAVNQSVWGCAAPDGSFATNVNRPEDFAALIAMRPADAASIGDARTGRAS